MKSEQKRLDRSTKTGVISNKSQAIPPSRPEVVLRCPNHSTAVQKKVDQSPEQQQGGTKRVLLGECWLSQIVATAS
jgi:hypothetical protein